jgi:dTDP-glucose pyrophosphorylase
MINILLPMAAKQDVVDSSGITIRRQMIEVGDKTIIERVIENYSNIKREKRFIFVIRADDSSRWHLDKTLALLVPDSLTITLTGETKGAACTALLAIKAINNDDALIIANTDQIIDVDFDEVIEAFEYQNADAGTICFPSVHPRWSYVLTDEAGRVFEATEKRPISKNAIAGFYYFSRGKDFVDAAMSTIYKDSNVNGQYFIAPTFNELILQQKLVVSYQMQSHNYHPLHSQKRIDQYEAYIRSQS